MASIGEIVTFASDLIFRRSETRTAKVVADADFASREPTREHLIYSLLLSEYMAFIWALQKAGVAARQVGRVEVPSRVLEELCYRYCSSTLVDPSQYNEVYPKTAEVVDGFINMAAAPDDTDDSRQLGNNVIDRLRATLCQTLRVQEASVLGEKAMHILETVIAEALERNAYESVFKEVRALESESDESLEE